MRVDVSEIKVGTRRREDMGDLKGLAASIRDRGLINPITLDESHNLVAGGRRLAAVRDVLHQPDIEARFMGELTAMERREIELDENTQRKDLTPYEMSRNLDELVRVAAAVDQQQLRAESARNSGPGRPPVRGSLRRVSERTGIPVKTIHDAQQHVEAVAKYPELGEPDVPQSVALQATKVLDALPEEKREATRATLRQNGGVSAATIKTLVRKEAETKGERKPGPNRQTGPAPSHVVVWAEVRRFADARWLALDPQAVAATFVGDDAATARGFIDRCSKWFNALSEAIEAHERTSQPWSA